MYGHDPNLHGPGEATRTYVQPLAFSTEKVKTRTATFYKKIRSSVLIFTDEAGGGESE